MKWPYLAEITKAETGVYMGGKSCLGSRIGFMEGAGKEWVWKGEEVEE